MTPVSEAFYPIHWGDEARLETTLEPGFKTTIARKNVGSASKHGKKDRLLGHSPMRANARQGWRT